MNLADVHSPIHYRFRWVQCQLDEKSRLRTDAALKRALNQLPSSLEGSYFRILAMIAKEDVPFAKRTLLWLAHASTPLSLGELAEAVVLEPDFKRLDPEAKLNDPNDLLEICRSLVAYNSVSNTVRIAHSFRTRISFSTAQQVFRVLYSS